MLNSRYMVYSILVLPGTALLLPYKLAFHTHRDTSKAVITSNLARRRTLKILPSLLSFGFEGL